jgi:hypothetical protein
VAAPILGRRGLAEAELMLHWAEIAGEDLTRICRPLKLSFARGTQGESKRDGTLQLRVLPAAAVELQHMEPQLIERINGFFGYRAVAKLALRQGPLPNMPRRPPAPKPLGAAEEQRLQQNLGSIDDDELRQALERLGRAVLGRR